ncbi:MAG TPA: pantoate--beta-alanine ligase, partial [Solirubrobacterales bacterium]
NPAQFNEAADLAAYPRTEAADAAMAEAAGVDIVFAPAPDEVYPAGFATTVRVAGPALGFEGEHRGAGHFEGVATVVLKLLHMTGPDVAYFGRKDAQQALVIQRMARDLDFPVDIEVLPTVREEDGIAMSSRNAYLDPEQRERATAIGRALRAAERAAREGETSTSALVEVTRRELGNAGIEPEYVEARSAEDLSPVAELNGRRVLVAVAARVGSARLIDNVVIAPPTTPEA